MANKLLVPYSDPKLRRQLMLKDYLLDDLSSCSSNGFRSFPRRQCCSTTVRFLLDIDLSKNNKNHQLLTKKLSKPTASPAARSVLQKASDLVFNAVKRLPLAAAKPRKAISPRSVSRKFFQRSFWKKSDRKEIEGWKSFHTVVEEKSEPPIFSPSKTAAAPTATRCSSESRGKNMKSNGCWSDSEFNSSSSSSSSGHSETVNSNDVVVESGTQQIVSNEVVGVGKTVAVFVGEDSNPTANCFVGSPKKQWSNAEEKEQFSPVSVLDCPFDNDDAEEGEGSSRFKRRLTRVEGTKHKLVQKLRRFESLTQLKPLDLEKRIALSESDLESVGSPSQPSLESIQENDISDDKEEADNETEKKAVELLEQMKEKTKINADNLFLDFFREGVMENNASETDKLLDVAKVWINWQPREHFLGWEVQKNREAYIRDMEKGGLWGSKLDEDNEEVGLELEAEIFTALVNELFLEVFALE